MSRAAWLREVRALVRRAGALVMEAYARGVDVRRKADASPVTEADEAAEALIVAGLARLAPDVPIIAEESVSRGIVPACGERFWLVDPLDGTREFIARNGEFTVNVALIEHGRPVLGVVQAPAVDELYAGLAGGLATLEDALGEREIRCRVPPADGLTVMASRSHDDEQALRRFLADRRVAEFRLAGSSLKLCRLAAGQADLYPRLGRTMEWDIAAGHAVLLAAGGRLSQLDGSELRYGKPGFENPSFVATGLPTPGPVAS